MRKTIRLTERELYRIVKRVIAESEFMDFGSEFESRIDDIINNYGVPETITYEELSGIELKDIEANYDEMVNSLKTLKNLVYTMKDNFEGNKKPSFLKRMFSKDERETIKDNPNPTQMTRKINRDIVELGRSYLYSNKIMPADEKIDMYDNMLEILSDKIDYVRQLKRDLILKLKGRTNHLSRKGDR